MPVINIEYDDSKVKKTDILALSKAIQKIVSEVTKIEDVPVYAHNAEVKVKVRPIEIFVRMSEHKISNQDKLMSEIKSKLSAWKKKRAFSHHINLSLIPMKWKIEIGI